MFVAFRFENKSKFIPSTILNATLFVNILMLQNLLQIIIRDA